MVHPPRLGDHRPQLEQLKQAVFDGLAVMRIYAKPPAKIPTLAGPTSCQGSTVEEFARKIHKDFYDNLKSARVGSATFDGQAVSRDHVLHDGDVGSCASRPPMLPPGRQGASNLSLAPEVPAPIRFVKAGIEDADLLTEVQKRAFDDDSQRFAGRPAGGPPATTRLAGRCGL